jgi:hypothetical protein
VTGSPWLLHNHPTQLLIMLHKPSWFVHAQGMTAVVRDSREESQLLIASTFL